MNNPKTKIENIIVQELENEVLIYDLDINKAYCLNQTSAMIYQLCNGKNSVAEISRILSRNPKQPITEDFVWLTLDQLKREDLLEKSEVWQIDFGGLSRREMIKKVGYASLVTLPLVVSVAAPKAIQAASDLCAGMNCDDMNLCTMDSCDPMIGRCINTLINCDDNNACTINSCDPQTGCVSTPRVCDDNNPCTINSCNPLTGCVFTPDPTIGGC